MTGFFGDFDIEGAADDPFGIPIGTYKGTISEFDGDISGAKKDGSGNYYGMQFTMTVTEGPQEGGEFDAYFPLPQEDTKPRDAGFMRSAIKKFLAGLEVPVDQMNTIDPNELVGLDVIFKVIERGSKTSSRKFKNLDEIRLDNGSNPWSDQDRNDSDGMDEFAVSSMPVSSAPIEDDEFGLS